MMNSFIQKLLNKQDKAPAGFKIETPGVDEVVIHYSNTGMGCMNLFLAIWLVGWAIGGFFVFIVLLSEGMLETDRTTAIGIMMIFLIFGIVFGIVLIVSIFGKKQFHLTDEALMMQTSVFGFKRHKLIPKSEIICLYQVKDGGRKQTRLPVAGGASRGRDSFPSWGLKVYTSRLTTLIYRQPYDKGHWLGKVLAQWADVQFHEVEHK